MRACSKVGYTTVDAQSRVAQQYPTLRPGKPPYRIVLEESAMRNDGTVFTDHDVHRICGSTASRTPKASGFGAPWSRSRRPSSPCGLAN